MSQKKLLAILGASGSGKSALALDLAKKLDAEIFSLDSLSIYKNINILSAKPTKQELDSIKHYGVDVLEISQNNNAMLFKNLLLEAIKKTTKNTLIIVGGSSFYLKAIIDGLSPMPEISPEIKLQINSLQDPYSTLKSIDKDFAQSIKPQDTYRIKKGLEIYFASKIPPTQYFLHNPPQKFPYKITTFCISIAREILREKIILRTQKMLDLGGIEEIQNLLKIYPKNAQPFKAIGPKECIDFLEGKIDFQTLKEQINTHTMQLAKRQTTFNKTQFQNINFLEKNQLFDEILRQYQA